MFVKVLHEVDTKPQLLLQKNLAESAHNDLETGSRLVAVITNSNKQLRTFQICNQHQQRTCVCGRCSVVANATN